SRRCRTTTPIDEHRPRSYHATGRPFVTELRHTGADVRSLTETLVAHASSHGGQLTSADLGRTLDAADVSPTEAKKLLRSLAEAGVTVVYDGSATTRRRVVAARSATAASKATTVRATGTKPAEATGTAPAKAA